MTKFFLPSIFSSLFLLAVWQSPVLAAEPLIAKSDITAATVYTNRAKVTREAVIDVPQGAQDIVVKGLPASLLPDSLRAEGTATGGDVVIGALAHKRVITKELSSEREAALTTELQTLKDKRTLLYADRSALQTQKTFLQNLGKQASLRADEAIAELNLHADQWMAAAQTLQQSMSDILKAEAAIDVKVRDLQEEMNRIQGELNQLRTGKRSTYEVTIPVEASGDATLTLALSYQVPGATWKPIYDARLKTDESAMTLVQYGAVQQRTGEDWSDVALTLSTAQPHRGASLPALSPQWVDVWDNDKVRPMAAAKVQRRNDLMSGFAASDAVMAESMGAAPQSSREVSFAQAQIETGGFVSEYKIVGPSDVPADGSETKLMVGAFETDSKIEIHIQPQMSTEAYLVANATLKGDAPILPGQVNLFRDGAYVGQSHFPMLRPDDAHDLFFGVDDQVTVDRKVLVDERKDAGIISRDNELTRHYITTVQNLHKDAVAVVVKETLPVARNEKIDIKINEKQTLAGYTQDDEHIKGLLRWDMELAPKEEQEIGLGWTVSWPKDHSLSGL